MRLNKFSVLGLHTQEPTLSFREVHPNVVWFWACLNEQSQNADRVSGEFYTGTKPTTAGNFAVAEIVYKDRQYQTHIEYPSAGNKGQLKCHMKSVEIHNSFG